MLTPTQLCGNSFASEILAFQHLGFTKYNQLADENLLSRLYPRQRVPDSIFATVDGNVAVEVKRVKNVMHKDTVINALSKMHKTIINDFDIKFFHIVFQTREFGPRDKLINVTRDVHGIMKKECKSIPYKIHNGPKVFIHVMKADPKVFKNIGY